MGPHTPPRSRLLRCLVPAGVAVCEVFGDPAAATLLPAEETRIASAVPKRRDEFRTGRWCARNALLDLGFAAVPIPVGEHGAPQWPAGVVGSITHCAGYRAAAVARTSHFRGIGVDAEPHDRLPDGVLAAITRPAERQRLRLLAEVAPGTHWDRLLFSAKESVYKAWFPLTRRWLDFTDADLTIDPATGTFTARLAVPGPHLNGKELTALLGRWLSRAGLIITSVAVPAA